ncbi:hypothetical protein ACFT8P_06205 [Streptomyces sp. NPDC057101]|uniref:hypothetical protein n=1 Tax=Streptomyces sp. NPDC057101 TaxID=3346020 RepID=UPI00362982ED
MRTTLVVATALIAGIAPAVLGGAGAVAAPAPGMAAQTAAGGAVVQEGGRPTFHVGSEVPAKSRFKVYLPAGETGPVKARIVLPFENPPMDSGPDTIPGHLTSTVSVNGAAPVKVDWELPTHPGVTDLSFVLDLPAVEAAATLTYDITFAVDDWLARSIQPAIDGRFEVTNTTGTKVAVGTAGFVIDLGTPSRDLRGAFHARDRSGVLWRFESLGEADSRLAPRTRIGAGWDAYTLLTQLTPTYANGKGNLLARDKAGVLWFHEGSGDPAKPFKPRVRISAGWNAYTAITGYGEGMLARDKDGVLWNFEYKDSWLTPTFLPRARVGAGWNTYTAWTGERDGVLTRDASGVLWKHTVDSNGTPAKPFRPRARVGGGWNVYNTIVSTPDLGRWTESDVVALDRDGRIWAYDTIYSAAAEGGIPGPIRRNIGWGFTIYNTVV